MWALDRKGYRIAFFVLGLMWTADCFAQTVDKLFHATASPYRIVDDLIVPFGEIWQIEPGSRFCFESNISLKIDGVLVAKGTRNKRITFSACDPNKPWGGVRFVDSREIRGIRSSLRHVVIEGASKRRTDPAGFDPNTAGGGLFVERSDLEVFRAVIRRNVAEIGGGVYIGQDSDVAIVSSAIYENTAVGSRYIYAGGGGLYVNGPRRLRVLRSIIAANRFLEQSYPNEEGGGGVYLAYGPLEFAFNLVIGNVSGKGAGMLVLSQGASARLRSFTGNIFAYNSGSVNLEQVALQTRNSFDILTGVGEWSTNAGQTPFVAHLNRNNLSRYHFKGSRAFLEQLQVGSEVDFASEIQDRANAAVLGSIDGALQDTRLCGEAFELGPIEICEGRGRKLPDYLSLVSEHYEPELGTILAERLAPPRSTRLNKGERTRLAKILAQAPYPHRAGEMSRAPLDSRLIDIVFADAIQRESAIDAIVSAGEHAPKRGRMSALLLANALGLNQTFDLLLGRSEPSLLTLQNAIGFRNEEVTLALLRARHYAGALSKKDLYDLLQRASDTNLFRVVEELLSRKVNPNLRLRERLPLAMAVAAGHLDTVQLLLRRGADPNKRSSMATGDNQLFPPLAFAITWFHLGSGRHEIAELLIAAGASLTEDEVPNSVWNNALRLKSAVELGVVSSASAKATARDREWESHIDRQIRQQIVDGKIVVRPILTAIRRLRSRNVAELAAILGDLDIPIAERAAAGRILSIRNFQLSESVRRDVLVGFRKPAVNGGPHIPSLESILRFRLVKPSPPLKGGASTAALKALSEKEERRMLLPYGRKLAVVIGISDYANLPSRASTTLATGRQHDLAFARADAEAIVRLLKSGRLGEGWEVEALFGERAKRSEVERVLTLWREEAREDDLVLFFFSGHGFNLAGESTDNFFFLYDSLLGRLKETALPFSDVRDWALALKSRHVLMLLDACRSGNIGSAKGSWSGVDYARLDDIRIRQVAGKIALTSSIGGQLSYEWENRGLGFFTATLLDAVEGRIAHYAQGRFITILDLYEAVRFNVIKRSSNERGLATQIPDYILLDGGDLLNFPIAFAW